MDTDICANGQVRVKYAGRLSLKAIVGTALAPAEISGSCRLFLNSYEMALHRVGRHFHHGLHPRTPSKKLLRDVLTDVK